MALCDRLWRNDLHKHHWDSRHTCQVICTPSYWTLEWIRIFQIINKQPTSCPTYQAINLSTYQWANNEPNNQLTLCTKKAYQPITQPAMMGAMLALFSGYSYPNIIYLLVCLCISALAVRLFFSAGLPMNFCLGLESKKSSNTWNGIGFLLQSQDVFSYLLHLTGHTKETWLPWWPHPLCIYLLWNNTQWLHGGSHFWVSDIF